MARLKGLITIVVILAAAYTGYKVVPVFFNNYQFQNELENQARVDSYSSRSAKEISDSVMMKAQQCNITLSPEQIRVERSGPELAISAEYTVHIDLPVHPFDMTFTPSTKNRRI